MELITNNPFRVLGLLPSADSTAFAARIREFEMHDEGLDQPNFAMDFPVLGKTHRRYRFEIQMAAWKIRDLRGKMFHSFFWFHSTNSTDQLALKCIAEENPEGALVIWNESIKRVNKTYSWKLNRAILSVWLLFAGKLPADKIGQIQQDIRLVTEQHLGEMQSYVLNNEDVAETWNRLVDTIGINKGYLDTIDEAIAANLDGISSIDFSVMVRDVARAAANIFEHSVKY